MSLKADHKVGFEINEPPTYAPTMRVPRIQELVKNNPLEVPKRYIRGPEEMEKSNYLTHLSSEIPVVDLALLSRGDSEELLKLHIACKDWGFFQLVNHGAEKEVIERMKEKTIEFLNLPIEEKNKYAMPADDIQGYGQANIVSEDQQLDWSDALVLLLYPTRYRKPQFWPQTPHGFKEIIEAYSRQVNRIGEEIIGSLSILMGMQKHVFVELHKELVQGLRVNHYPPCNTPEQVVGLTPHSDATTITLLLQDDDVCGLEIRHDGGWVPVPPIPGALVISVGDALEIWSNGKYKSIEHRAMTNKNKGRSSYATFFYPRDDVELQPLEGVVDAQNPRMYKNVIYGEYLRQCLNKKLEGKKANIDLAKINV